MKKIMLALLVLCIALSIYLVKATSKTVKEEINQEINTAQIMQDATGAEITLAKKPERVVFLSASHLDLFVAAGGKDKIVGVPLSNTFSPEVKAAIAGVQEIGQAMAPNSEVIMSLNPDLVVGINWQPHLALRPSLEQAGIPMYLADLDTYEQVLQLLAFYGDLAGSPEVAQAKIIEVQAQYEQALAKASGKKAPTNLIIWGTPDSFSMGTKKSFVGDLLERLGGGSILDFSDYAEAEEAFLPLSMEYLTKVDPEMIFLITHGSPEGLREKFSREMRENPVWSEMQAVKNRRIYTLPYQLFAVNPGSQISLALNILADYMYGEADE